MMSRFSKLYRHWLNKYPLRIQAVQSGILMGLGDQIAQNFIDEHEKEEKNDWIRTLKFCAIGFCFAGPVTYKWYSLLDKYISGRAVAIKKVTCDQLVFAPCFIAVLISSVGFMQGNDWKTVQYKLSNEYTDILKNNYKVWPMVQLVNFAFIPLRYQVLVVQVVAVLWNSYVSYRTNRDIVRISHT